MKNVIIASAILLLVFNTAVSPGQGIIRHDTVIKKVIAVNDTFSLDFLYWPSPGICWALYSEYDTTQLSIRETFVRLLEGKQFGGKYVATWRYIGLKPGEVTLEYYWGRPWLKEKEYQCLIEVFIVPEEDPD